jgi:ABC-2 type transport system permease protein
VIGHIFRHELRLMIRDQVLWYLLPVFAVLVGYAIYNGISWSRFQSATVAEARQNAQSNLDELKARVIQLEKGGALASTYDDPRDAGIVSRVYAFEMATLPPTPMAPLAIGQSDLYPYYVQLNAKPIDDQPANDEIENPTNLSTGRFDLGFVIVYLFPLLILALSFNLLSVEREQGTQALMLSQPIRLRQIITGKVLLRATVVLGTAILLALIGFLLGGLAFSASSLWHLGMWIVTVAAYGSFWFGLAIIVNALGRKSSTNAMILIAAWLFFVLLLPAALNVFAKSLYPVPSRIELVQATRRATDAVLRDNSQFATKAMEDANGSSSATGDARGAQTLREYYQRIIGAEKQIAALSAPVKQRFATQMAAQQALVARLHFLTPAVMTETAISELAGTGAARYQSFNREVIQYHDRWADYFMPYVLSVKSLTPSDYDGIPRFHMPAEKPSQVAARSFREIAPLCLFGLVVIGLGLIMLRNYKVVG